MYKISLKDFEGPLDLLLFFIKRDELDIYDIPISVILKEFLEYMHQIDELDLEIAGEFIMMASTLMHIKARMLLPREVNEKGEEIDPREELVQRLLEYMRYKEMTGDLSDLESRRRRITFRKYFELDEAHEPHDFDVLLKNITLYDLSKAFKKVIDDLPKITEHQVRKLTVSAEEQVQFILNKLAEKAEIDFSELVNGMVEKIRVIVTFIVLLELVKSQTIQIRGGENPNNFIIAKA
ncbi:MAG: segregation/condensation protein A [Ignavibacteria bacterium]|nr:segregation/condensation protein A [Ignavibacteria bacterium]